ncbi:MAG: TolC family protein [Bacteroidetes bacterium]|nr:TolC family protein [Bacteroidota bacterium]
MKKQFILIIYLLLFGSQVFSQTQPLDYYINKAIKNSPLLNDYQNQFQAVKMDSLLIKAGEKIQIDANSQVMYSPVVTGWGYDEAITNGANISGLVGVKKNIIDKKARENIFNGLSLQKQMVGNSIKVSVKDIRKAVTSQYLTAFLDYSEITFNQSQLEILKNQLQLMKRLVESGIYKQTDYLSLLVEIQSLELMITQLNGQYENDLYSLNLLCGINDPTNVKLAQPEIVDSKELNIEQSPLFMQFRIDSLKIENEKKIIADQIRPKLNLFADAGLMSSTLENIYKRFGVSAGINLNIPLYDGGQRKLQIQKLTLSELSRSSYQHFFKSQYNQQIMQLYAELSITAKVISQINEQLLTLRDFNSMAKIQMGNGLISITEYLSSVKNLLTLNKTLNQTTIKRLQLINELNYLKQQ